MMRLEWLEARLKGKEMILLMIVEEFFGADSFLMIEAERIRCKQIGLHLLYSKKDRKYFQTSPLSTSAILWFQASPLLESLFLQQKNKNNVKDKLDFQMHSVLQKIIKKYPHSWKNSHKDNSS